MFNAYDADGNGYLDPSEVFNIFKASLGAKGKHVSGEEIRAMVQKLFSEVRPRVSVSPNWVQFVLAGGSG